MKVDTSDAAAGDAVSVSDEDQKLPNPVVRNMLPEDLRVHLEAIADKMQIPYHILWNTDGGDWSHEPVPQGSERCVALDSC